MYDKACNIHKWKKFGTSQQLNELGMCLQWYLEDIFNKGQPKFKCVN